MVYKTERLLEPGQVVKYRRHGSFELCYAGYDHAVIKHTTLSGKVMHLFVPERRWLAVSNGSFKTSEPYYDTYLNGYGHLRDKPRLEPVHIIIIERPPAAPTSESINRELYDKYHVLFDTFNGYWQANFAESVQEDVDLHTFELGARIRYGLTCVMEGQQIPFDCDYAKLLEEVEDWIGYREGRFD